MVGAGTLAVLDLGLGDGRAVVDVPERRGLGAVGLAASEVAQERELAGAPADVVDRRVEQRPVVREPEAPEQLLEHRLVGGGQLVAELDEVGPRDRDFLVTVRRVAAVRRLGSRGRSAGTGRTARRSSSARAARWPARCRPSRSGRRRPCRSSAGSGRCSRCGCTRRRCPCGSSPTPWAVGCRRRTRRCGRDRRAPLGRTGRRRRPPSARPSAPRCRRASACPGPVGIRAMLRATGPNHAGERRLRSYRWVRAPPVRHRHAGGPGARHARARQGEHLPLRSDGVRPAAPRSRPVRARVRRPDPLPALAGRRRAAGLQRDRHRRPDHRAGPARSNARGRRSPSGASGCG